MYSDVGAFSDSLNPVVRQRARAVISTEVDSTGVSGVGSVVMCETFSSCTEVSLGCPKGGGIVGMILSSGSTSGVKDVGQSVMKGQRHDQRRNPP